MICWKCGKQIDQEIYRTTCCNFCGAMLHCCKGCRFYSPGSHFDCAESAVLELVKDKEKENFCDWFQAKKDSNGNVACATNTKAQDAKKAFASLFMD